MDDEQENHGGGQTSRGRYIRMEDMIQETEFRVAYERGYDSYLSPCRSCHGGRRYSLQTIKTHLRVNGRDEMLNFSMLGGDPPQGYPREGIHVHGQDKVIEDRNVFDDGVPGNEYAEQLDPFHDVQRNLFDAFDVGDRIREETPHREDVCDGQEAEYDLLSEKLELLEELYVHASKQLYAGLNISVISATIVIINMAVIHGVSNAYVDELLKYLATVLLPVGNLLPSSHYEAKRLIRKLGLNYNIIHACPKGCVLYRKEYKDLECCPKPTCGLSRFIPRSNSIPAKVIRHFPLIPRLMRMMRSEKIANLLRWHTDFPNEEKSTVMKSVADSPAWDHVDTHVDPTFKLDPRNMRFGLALDGVNPFKHNNTQHSTWPILMLLYNLPPFLVTKFFFIQLCILISGKDAPTPEGVDVFIRPLIEELQLLWTGVPAQDFSQPAGNRLFNLRGILLWTISDYPSYGLISGICTHGHKGCAICGPHTESRSASSGNKLNAENKVRGSKVIYGGGRRWLRRNHPYRESLDFNGRVEHRAAPVRMTAAETVRCGRERGAYIAQGGRDGGRHDPAKQHGVKQLNALYNLVYWKVLILFPFMRSHMYLVLNPSYESV
jgi:hypothetical protein